MICDTTNETSTATTCVTNSESSTPECTPTCDVTTEFLTPQTSTQKTETVDLPNVINDTSSASEIKPVVQNSPNTPDPGEIITTINPGMIKAVKTKDSIIVLF